MQNFAVFITWEELYGEIPTEAEVRTVLQQLNRQSTVLLLARIGIHLFLERIRANNKETAELQSFLIANFWNEDVLAQAKKILGGQRLDFRRGFHLQQVLTLLKWAMVDSQAIGGVEPDKTQDARYQLGSCLLKTSDLLLSSSMRGAIARGRKSRSPKHYLNLQLHAGAGNEINNPPPVVNAVVRSERIFGELLKQSTSTFDLNGALKERTGISIDTYLDLTIGALATYLGRTQKDLIENPGLATINPRTFFGHTIPANESQQYWEMESCTMEDLATVLSSKSELQPQQDFTAFRMKPFVSLDTGVLVCANPGFVQEKLEIGLFWTIVNTLKAEDRKKAFDAWGELFQKYVNKTFESAIDHSKENYLPFPGFSEKKHRHEAFDAVLVSGQVCAVFEFKAGFLPNRSKYAEQIDQFLSSLNQKFGMEPRAGIEQLVRKIAQLFDQDQTELRSLEGVESNDIKVVIPVLIVQDNFVSSFLAIPFLAKLFRDSMRGKNLRRGVMWTSLLVLHIEDVENLSTHIKAGHFSLTECLLYAAKKGDPGPSRLFAFADILREFLEGAKIVRVPETEFDKKFAEIINRLTLRLFNKKLERLQVDA
jgi:hypothetical protein